jgi:hypothetical protein
MPPAVVEIPHQKRYCTQEENPKKISHHTSIYFHLTDPPNCNSNYCIFYPIMSNFDKLTFSGKDTRMYPGTFISSPCGKPSMQPIFADLHARPSAGGRPHSGQRQRASSSGCLIFYYFFFVCGVLMTPITFPLIANSSFS